MGEKSALDWITSVLVVIGALNWGLVGIFQLDLVATILGSITWLQNLVYILVGVSGLWALYGLFK